MLAQSLAYAGTNWMWVPSVSLGVLGASLLLLVYPAVVLRKYVRIMIHILDDHGPGLENGSNKMPPLEGERISFRAVDGHGLQGVILSGNPAGPCGGMILFAHEFSSDHSKCLRYCQSLLDQGFDIFTFDFRGHGASPPEQGYHPRFWPSDRERADMLGAIAFIGSWLEQHGRPRDVGIFGISRGGGSAILASVGIDSVKAIVTDGAFSSDSTMEYLMRRFATIFAKIRIVAQNHPPTFWRFLRWLLFRECRRRFHCYFPSVRKAIMKLGRKPIFFIHGGKDSYIPPEQSQMLYNQAFGPKHLWIVSGAKHNQSIRVEPDAYASQIGRFFIEHLGGQVAPPAFDPPAVTIPESVSTSVVVSAHVGSRRAPVAQTSGSS